MTGIFGLFLRHTLMALHGHTIWDEVLEEEV
jgi:hypothetical protein